MELIRDERRSWMVTCISVLTTAAPGRIDIDELVRLEMRRLRSHTYREMRMMIKVSITDFRHSNS